MNAIAHTQQRYDGPELFVADETGNMNVRLVPGLRIGLDEQGLLELGAGPESGCVEFFVNEANKLAMRTLGAYKMIAGGREAAEVPVNGACHVDLGAVKFQVAPSLQQIRPRGDLNI